MHVPDRNVLSACSGPARRGSPGNAFLRLGCLRLLLFLLVLLPGRASADAPSIEVHRWTDPAGQPVFSDRIAGVSGEIVTTRVPIPDAAQRARAEQERAYWQAQSAAFARRPVKRPARST